MSKYGYGKTPFCTITYTLIWFWTHRTTPAQRRMEHTLRRTHTRCKKSRKHLSAMNHYMYKYDASLGREYSEKYYDTHYPHSWCCRKKTQEFSHSKSMTPRNSFYYGERFLSYKYREVWHWSYHTRDTRERRNTQNNIWWIMHQYDKSWLKADISLNHRKPCSTWCPGYYFMMYGNRSSCTSSRYLYTSLW